ncbi:MAG TPA: Gfo/Idh/MocA family oxidoreductase [Sphingomonadaceae bacterium]|nr:Gfo/Idh/MocA family oxidoreductase [Sphingomonadaceae bacterium]
MTRPRVGFLGVGWIGRNRMEAMLATGAVDAVAIADPSAETAAEAAGLAPGAVRVASLDEMLDFGVDGVVIATPSALHAHQAIQALERGAAVFCQKPLGRSAAETGAVVEAARAADRLLAVDLSYRFTQGMFAIRDLVRTGALGRVFAVDLVFHNAYGPDKPWFYDRALSGGGCVMDLGVHLVDLALWALDFPEVTGVSSRLFAGGAPLDRASAAVEDYAVASLDLAPGVAVRLACSWRLPAGQNAVISVELYGTAGGASMRNLHGGFAEFAAARHEGTATVPLGGPDAAWSGGAAADWAMRLAAGERFDRASEQLTRTAAVLDRIYAG